MDNAGSFCCLQRLVGGKVIFKTINDSLCPKANYFCCTPLNLFDRGRRSITFVRDKEEQGSCLDGIALNNTTINQQALYFHFLFLSESNI